MAAKSETLSQLHEMLASVMLSELKWYAEQDPPIPVPAADKAAIAKFLKDNNVTADPVDEADLAALRDAFKEQLAGRRTKIMSAVQAAKEDMEKLYPHQMN